MALGKIEVSIVDMDLFEEIIEIMYDMYEMADEDTRVVVDFKLDNLTEKCADRVRPIKR